MNAFEFTAKLQTYFGKEYAQEQARVIAGYCRRFTSEQLDAILQRLYQDVEYLPKLSRILEAAGDLGFRAKSGSCTPIRSWGRTDCRYCAGEGVVIAVYRVEGLVMHLQAIHGRNSMALQQRKRGPMECELLYRCSCERGGLVSTPTAQWSGARTMRWDWEQQRWIPDVVHQGDRTDRGIAGTRQ